MFTAVITSLVSDILLPPLSIILPLNKNLEEKFAVLRKGPQYDADMGYNTLEIARNDGAVVLAYGYFCLSLSSSGGLVLMRGTKQILSQQAHQLCRRRALALRPGVDVSVVVVGPDYQAHG